MRGSVTNYCVVNSSTQNENLKRHIGQHTQGRSQLWSVQLFSLLSCKSQAAHAIPYWALNASNAGRLPFGQDILNLKKQQNTTPRQQCFGLNDLGRLISLESQWWDETNQMSTVSLWITHTTILAIHYVKVYIFTSAVFWAQWPAPVDFREESQLPVVPLHTGSPSANMNCLRVLILPPPTIAIHQVSTVPTAYQPQVITRARAVRATQGGSYTTTHRVGPWFLGRSPGSNRYFLSCLHRPSSAFSLLSLVPELCRLFFWLEVTRALFFSSLFNLVFNCNSWS